MNYWRLFKAVCTPLVFLMAFQNCSERDNDFSVPSQENKEEEVSEEVVQPHYCLPVQTPTCDAGKVAVLKQNQEGCAYYLCESHPIMPPNDDPVNPPQDDPVDPPQSCLDTNTLVCPGGSRMHTVRNGKGGCVVSFQCTTAISPSMQETWEPQVREFFVACLGREPASETISNIFNKLELKEYTMADLEHSACNAKQAHVRAYFNKYFLKEPSQSDYDHWIGRMDREGMDWEQLRQVMRNNWNCQLDCAHGDNTYSVADWEAIAGAHRVYFAREPLPDEAKNFLQMIKVGEIPVSSVSLILSDTREAQIKNLYLTHLNKYPDRLGVLEYLRLMNQGEALYQIASRIRRRADCVNSCL